MLLRLETLYVDIKNANAVDITFLGMTTKQLLSYADAQDGLSKIFDYLIEMVCLQIFHGFSCLTLAREENTVCLLEHLGIIRQSGIDAQTLHGIDYGIDISGVVFYDCYIHNLTLFLLKTKHFVVYRCKDTYFLSIKRKY